MTQIFHTQPMIFNPLSMTSISDYVKFTNGNLLIIMLKCKGYIHLGEQMDLNLISENITIISHITSKISKIIGITTRLRHFCNHWYTVHPLSIFNTPLLILWLHCVGSSSTDTSQSNSGFADACSAFNLFCLLLISCHSCICLFLKPSNNLASF